MNSSNGIYPSLTLIGAGSVFTSLFNRSMGVSVSGIFSWTDQNRHCHLRESLKSRRMVGLGAEWDLYISGSNEGVLKQPAYRRLPLVTEEGRDPGFFPWA